METKHQFVDAVGGSADDQSRLENDQKSTSNLLTTDQQSFLETDQQSTNNLLKNNVTEPDDDFACFEKYGNGIGSKLLKKHGWREGMGLGKLSTGRALPLTLTECDARKPRQKQGIGYKIEQVADYPIKRSKIDGMKKRTNVKSWTQNRYQHKISDYDAPFYYCNYISAPPPYPYSFPQDQFVGYFPDYPPPYVDYGNPSPFGYPPSEFYGQAQLSFQWESQFFGYPVPTPYSQVRYHVPIDAFCQNTPPVSSIQRAQTPQSEMIPQSQDDIDIDMQLERTIINIPLPSSAKLHPNQLNAEKEAADILAKLNDGNTIIAGVKLVRAWMGRRRKQLYMKELSYDIYKSAHKPTSVFKDDHSRSEYVKHISKLYDVIETRELKMFTMDKWCNVLLFMLNTSIEFGFERNFDQIKLLIVIQTESNKTKETKNQKRKNGEYFGGISYSFVPSDNSTEPSRKRNMLESNELDIENLKKKRFDDHGQVEEMNLDSSEMENPIPASLENVSHTSDSLYMY